MKAIMLSVQPQWVEKILSGEKTIEIRKTMPKCELPCKVYIYCTQSRKWIGLDSYQRQRQVVAEFILDAAEPFLVFENGSVQYWNLYGLERSCLTYEQISKYVGKGKTGYAWHIRDLKIYDEPKKLGEFYAASKDEEEGPFVTYEKTERCLIKKDGGVWQYLFGLTCPPQSWCYVEDRRAYARDII